MKFKLIIFSIFLIFSISCIKIDDDNSKKEINSKVQEEKKSIHQEEWEKYKAKVDNSFDSSIFKIELSDPTIVVDSSIGKFFQPKFTSDGKKLIFTTENYIGLWIYNFQNKILEQINNLPQSGYQYIYSKLDNSIYFLNKAARGKKREQAYTIVKLNLDSKSVDVIYSSEKWLTRPQLVNDQILFLEDKELKCYSITSKKMTNKIVGHYILVKENILTKYKSSNDTGKVILKFPKIASILDYDSNYIFCLTLSNGIIICDYDGVIINQFSEARTISRLKNSNLVIFTKEKDDGQKITSSELYLGFINSNAIKAIKIDTNHMKFNPNWSPNENKIVFNDENGNIKLVKFKIK